VGEGHHQNRSKIVFDGLMDKYLSIKPPGIISMRSITVYAMLLTAVLTAGCASASITTAEQLTPIPTLTPVLEPTAPKEKIPLRVFCAGSLIVPFNELENAFEAAHPDVDVLTECHGSIQVIRHVTELHETIDVVATADYALIPLLMYKTIDQQTGKPYADWYIRFATNQMTLAYSSFSQYATQINADNWYDILTKPGLRIGLADPRFDAAGYRALMVLRLAENAYNRTGILKSLLEGQFRLPITTFEEDNYTEISVPEILEPKQGAKIVLRGASIQLIALLQSGDLDYAFEYESVTRQHKLQWITLPDAINLGFASYNPEYNQVQVKMDFQRFASVKPVFKGEQIGYGIVIPSNAPHPDLAAEFIAFLLGPDGRTIMEANFQPLLEQPTCDQLSRVPQTLQSLCKASEQP
jgi:molybdate/tungstate transport system substrate-binding protein